MVGSEADLHEGLFGQTPYAEVMIAEVDGQAAGHGSFISITFLPFLMKPGYLFRRSLCAARL